MADYLFVDVVLAEFPYADENETKRRPALILSQDADDDLIFLRITSKIRPVETDVFLQDWSAAGLRLPSVVRLEKVVTSNVSFVLKRLGTLSRPDTLRELAGLRTSCDRISSART